MNPVQPFLKGKLLALFLIVVVFAWPRVSLAVAADPSGQSGPERFGRVKSWRLTVKWDFQMRSPAGSEHEVNVGVKGRAVYKLVAKDGGPRLYFWQLEKNFQPKGAFHADFKHITWSDGQEVYTARGGADGWKEGGARLEIDPETGKFRLHAYANSKDSQARYKTLKSPPQTVPFFVPLASAPVGRDWVQPLPDQGLTIKAERDDVPCPILQAAGRPMHVSLELQPWDMEEPPEVVVSIMDYAQWLPESGKGFTIRAKLRDKEGEKLRQTAKQITFELLETSKLPGTCCNAPAQPQGDPGFDMEFEPVQGLICSPDGQQAKTAEGDHTQAQAGVACWDYGAASRLKVTAVMQDGQTVTGYLEGDPSMNEIRLPKRAADSRIADAWMERNRADGLSDDSDEDPNPREGDGCQGDGLTLFEEYRGFMMEGTHARTDPRQKDFFVVNRIGPRTRQGVDLVTGTTNLTAHYVKDREEADAEGVVNMNHGNAPHLADKWAVIIENFRPKDRSWESFSFGEGGPGYPKRVRICPAEDPAWNAFARTWNNRIQTDRYASVMAHEILHCLGLVHHGDSDPGEKYWTQEPGANGLPVIKEYDLFRGNTRNGRVIQVRKENGTTVAPGSRELSLPSEMWVAGPGGEHSGMEDCLMRYSCAQAYMRPGEPDVRYLVDEEMPGISLCATQSGTGVNAPGRRPWSRYGDAGSGGACKTQFCVNDAKHLKK